MTAATRINYCFTIYLFVSFSGNAMVTKWLTNGPQSIPTDAKRIYVYLLEKAELLLTYTAPC